MAKNIGLLALSFLSPLRTGGSAALPHATHESWKETPVKTRALLSDALCNINAYGRMAINLILLQAKINGLFQRVRDRQHTSVSPVLSTRQRTSGNSTHRTAICTKFADVQPRNGFSLQR